MPHQLHCALNKENNRGTRYWVDSPLGASSSMQLQLKKPLTPQPQDSQDPNPVPTLHAGSGTRTSPHPRPARRFTKTLISWQQGANLAAGVLPALQALEGGKQSQHPEHQALRDRDVLPLQPHVEQLRFDYPQPGRPYAPRNRERQHSFFSGYSSFQEKKGTSELETLVTIRSTASTGPWVGKLSL